MAANLVSVRKPDLEIIGFLSRRRRHLERSPSGTRLCSQPENANFLSEMFPDRHLEPIRKAVESVEWFVIPRGTPELERGASCGSPGIEQQRIGAACATT